MRTANSSPPGPSRAVRLLSIAAPALNGAFSCAGYVAGGAGLAAAILVESALGLILSTALLGASAALYVINRPADDE